MRIHRLSFLILVLASIASAGVILFDNGPLVTHPGGGAGGADASAVQTSLLMSVYGFGHAVSTGFRVADDFTVSPVSGWDIGSITFFAYQTGAATSPSTITAVNLRIWDGDPSDAGSNVIWGDVSTNRLVSSAWANVYRVLDTALTNTQRPIMANVVAVGTHLPQGTYWLDWQTDGSLASGPWAPPITILGQTTTGNALQFNPSSLSYSALLDSGSGTQQDLPFVIEGPEQIIPEPSTSVLIGVGLIALALVARRRPRS